MEVVIYQTWETFRSWRVRHSSALNPSSKFFALMDFTKKGLVSTSREAERKHVCISENPWTLPTAWLPVCLVYQTSYGSWAYQVTFSLQIITSFFFVPEDSNMIQVYIIVVTTPLCWREVAGSNPALPPSAIISEACTLVPGGTVTNNASL